MKNALGRMWQKSVVANFEELSEHFPGVTDKITEHLSQYIRRVGQIRTCDKQGTGVPTPMSYKKVCTIIDSSEQSDGQKITFIISLDVTLPSTCLSGDSCSRTLLADV